MLAKKRLLIDQLAARYRTPVAHLSASAESSTASGSELNVNPKPHVMRNVMVEAMGEVAIRSRAPDARRLLLVFVDDLDRCASKDVFGRLSTAMFAAVDGGSLVRLQPGAFPGGLSAVAGLFRSRREAGNRWPKLWPKPRESPSIQRDMIAG